MNAKSESGRRTAFQCSFCEKRFVLTVKSSGTARQKCPGCGKKLVLTKKTRRYDWYMDE